jgi:ATP-binding cassette subfamily C protein CydC
MDNIIFMKDGQIEMEGTHLQMLERQVHYRRLNELERPVIDANEPVARV